MHERQVRASEAASGRAMPVTEAGSLPKRVGMAERRRVIRDRVEAEGYAAVSRLSEALGVSAVTIRADLKVLESQGAVRRVHGGAIRVPRHLRAARAAQ